MSWTEVNIAMDKMIQWNGPKIRQSQAIISIIVWQKFEVRAMSLAQQNQTTKYTRYKRINRMLCVE